MTAAWTSVRLGDVLRRSENIINLDPDQTYREVKVRLHGKGVVERRQVKGVEIASDRRFEASAGQFIVSRIDARHGASGIVPPDLDGAIVTNDFPLFDVVCDRLTPDFLYWMSKTASFVDLCKRASEGTTNRVRLSESRFVALEIPLPPLSEQVRVVARIDELAKKVANAQLLRNELSREIGALQSSHSRQLFESLNDPRVPLETVCSTIVDNLHTNPAYSDNGTVPCIRSPDVGFGMLNLDGAKRTDEHEFVRRTIRGAPQPDDIVLVREGGGTGKCALVLPGQRFSLGQRVMMLRPDQAHILPRFFLYQLLSPVIQEDYIQPLAKGSASPHLNIGSLRQFPLVLPSIDDQRSIISKLDALDAKFRAVMALQLATSEELDAMLPAILYKAFNGGL
jgi:type I restriction enzyme S subunit